MSLVFSTNRCHNCLKDSCQSIQQRVKWDDYTYSNLTKIIYSKIIICYNNLLLIFYIPRILTYYYLYNNNNEYKLTLSRLIIFFMHFIFIL